MLPQRHLLLSSVLAAALWGVKRNHGIVPSALIAGCAPDLDHVVDYICYGLTGEHRLILPFHAYEWILPLYIVGKRRWGKDVATALVVSYAAHLFADQIENRTKWLGYSFLFRLVHSFDLERISTDPVAAAQGRINDMSAIRRVLQRLKLL